MIITRDLHVSYGEKEVIRGIDTAFKAGTVTAVIGPNGSGKSSLIRALAGVQPYQGSIQVEGSELRDMRRKAKVEALSLVAQQTELSADLKVRDIVALGRTAGRGPFAQVRGDDEHEISRALRHAGVSELAERAWHELSGGERQRVQLARAAAQGARAMLLDEPTNHLDLHHQFRLLRRTEHLAHTHGITVIIALHDLSLAARFADKVIVLRGGEKIAEGHPQEVLTPDLLRETFAIEAIFDNGLLRVEKEII